MERLVIACYRPRAGRSAELHRLMQTHLSTLRAEGLVTDRESIVMQSEDGTVIEVFEWKSRAAIEAAHSNPAVQAMWARYQEVAEYVPLTRVTEAGALFSEFAPLPIN